jgi:lipopolysaccharide biosynthesis glycosyltransferase
MSGVTPNSYFTAGVLACRRDTWLKYGRISLDAFFKNSRSFIRHDQSALNSVFQNRVEPFSPSLNFHNVYSDLGLDSIVPVKIIHFTAPKKPWKTAAGHWRGRFHSSYTDLVRRFPEISSVFEVGPLEIEPRVRDRITVESVRSLRQNNRQRKMFINYIMNEKFAVVYNLLNLHWTEFGANLVNRQARQPFPARGQCAGKRTEG